MGNLVESGKSHRFVLWWIIDRGFEGENLDAGECDMVRNGQITGTEFFMRY